MGNARQSKFGNSFETPEVIIDINDQRMWLFMITWWLVTVAMLIYAIIHYNSIWAWLMLIVPSSAIFLVHRRPFRCKLCGFVVIANDGTGEYACARCGTVHRVTINSAHFK